MCVGSLVIVGLAAHPFALSLSDASTISSAWLFTAQAVIFFRWPSMDFYRQYRLRRARMDEA
jgi:hypothetical protein